MIIMKAVLRSAMHRKARVAVGIAAVALGVAFVMSTWLLTRSGSLMVVAAPVALRLMYQTKRMLTDQRVRPLATVRAIGAKRGQIARAVLLEAFAVGLAGSLLGAAAAWLTAGEMTGKSAVTGILAGTLTTMLAAYVSMRRVVLRSPAVALRLDMMQRHVSQWPPQLILSVVALLVGTIAVLASMGDSKPGEDHALALTGVLIIWVTLVAEAPLLMRAALSPLAWLAQLRAGSTTSRLALRDAIRHPQRTATVAASLMTGVALVCAFAAGGTLLGLAVLVAVFDVAKTVTLSGLDRDAEISMMRAVGASPQFVWQVVRREIATICVCGALFGAGTGLLIGYLIRHVTTGGELPDLPVAVLLHTALVAGMVTVAVVAAWLPTRRAAQVNVRAMMTAE